MLFLLLSFKNNHCDVRILLGLRKLLLYFAHKLDVDIDVFIGLQLALHRCDCKHLFGLSFFHTEVETDWVLSLILEVKWQFFWFSDTNCSKVKFCGHSIIQRDVKGLCINLD